MSADNKVQVLENDYAKTQYAKYAQQQRQIIFRRRRLTAVFLVAAVVFLSVGISLLNDRLRLNQLQDYKQEAVAEQKEMETKVKGLTRDVALLHDDEYVAKVARSRFFYSNEGEIVYALPNTEQKKEAKN